MPTQQTRVRQHTRTSKNGKVHTVKSHNRTTTMADILKGAIGKATPKKVAVGAAAVSVFSALMWVLSTSMSVMSAAIWAILLICMSIITYGLMTKGQRKYQRRKLRESAATSMKRRVKLWSHHVAVKAKKPVSGPPQNSKTKKENKKSTQGVTHQQSSSGDAKDSGLGSMARHMNRMEDARFKNFTDQKKNGSEADRMERLKRTGKLTND